MKTLLADIPALQAVAAQADHSDDKPVTLPLPASAALLRTFIAGVMNYYPAWVKALYGVRWGFVRLLGLRQHGVPAQPTFTAATVPLQVGAQAAFFTVVAVEPARFWMASASESHLSAYLAIGLEPLSALTTCVHTLTLVHYHRWTGPVYFNAIRPFHHLVVGSMVAAGRRYALAQLGARAALDAAEVASGEQL